MKEKVLCFLPGAEEGYYDENFALDYHRNEKGEGSFLEQGEKTAWRRYLIFKIYCVFSKQQQ